MITITFNYAAVVTGFNVVCSCSVNGVCSCSVNGVCSCSVNGVCNCSESSC